MKSSAPIWLFDGVCILCSSAVLHVLKHERTNNLRFVAIQSHEGRTLAKQHGLDPDNPDSFLFIENNKSFAKSDGVFALLNHVNGAARMLRFGKVLPKTLRDWLYDRIARNRYNMFGKSSVCMVPSEQNRHRFALPN
jgi:predicted DCC family thiol-disulfide oxidoreductase YuxK